MQRKRVDMRLKFFPLNFLELLGALSQDQIDVEWVNKQFVSIDGLVGDLVQEQRHLDILFVCQQKRVRVQFYFHPFHCVVLDTFQVNLFFPVRLEVGQSRRISRNFVPLKKPFDVRVLSLARHR